MEIYSPPQLRESKEYTVSDPPFPPCLGRHCCVGLECRFPSTAKCSSGSEANLIGSLRLAQHSEGVYGSFKIALTVVREQVGAQRNSGLRRRSTG
jgi:hypothetical protein